LNVAFQFPIEAWIPDILTPSFDVFSPSPSPSPSNIHTLPLSHQVIIAIYLYIFDISCCFVSYYLTFAYHPASLSLLYPSLSYHHDISNLPLLSIRKYVMWCSYLCIPVFVRHSLSLFHSFSLFFHILSLSLSLSRCRCLIFYLLFE
jgi:hypothetical protein